MKILFHLGHPAHFHLFRDTWRELRDRGHRILLAARRKDILETLLQEAGETFANLLPRGRGDSRLDALLGMLKADVAMIRLCLTEKPDVLLGTSVAIAHAGALLGIPRINVNEDDAAAVPLYAKAAYPFSSVILAPEPCDCGRWKKIKIGYPGYHELAYLHPRRFTPDPARLRPHVDPDQPFFILRFSALAAHHDAGKRGINWDLAREIIDRLQPNGRVMISSERELEPEFEPYRFPLHPRDMHHAMAYARMVVADSQTMTAEAAVLGTPVLRFNDFVGKLSYLEELEHTYGLTKGIPTTEPDRLLSTIEEWLNQKDLRSEWKVKRERMLRDKIDVTAFFVWFIENYPGSVAEVKAEGFDWGKFK